MLDLQTHSRNRTRKCGFPGGSDDKESACNAEDLALIPVLKIPWRREWLPTPVFLPGKLQEQRSWRATVYGVAKSAIQLSNFHFHFLLYQHSLACSLALQFLPLSSPGFLLCGFFLLSFLLQKLAIGFRAHLDNLGCPSSQDL